MRNFVDRYDAGEKLAQKIKNFDIELNDFVCLALPRGGVPVAYEVAKRFDMPLDVVISRKVGAPFNPEFAIGAISEGGNSYYDEATLSSLNIDPQTLDALEKKEREELKRRAEKYRGGRELPSLQGKDVFLIDDGLATGATAKSAVKFLRSLEPNKIIFCAPVCAYDSSLELEKKVNDLISILKPRTLSAIGMYYIDFGQTSDEEVIKLLRECKRLVE